MPFGYHPCQPSSGSFSRTTYARYDLANSNDAQLHRSHLGINHRRLRLVVLHIEALKFSDDRRVILLDFYRSSVFPHCKLKNA